MSRGFADTYLSSKGQVAMKAALYDSGVHGTKKYYIMVLNKGLILTVITTKECGELCGIVANFDGRNVYIEDPLAVVFGPTGPHFPKPGGEECPPRSLLRSQLDVSLHGAHSAEVGSGMHLP